MKRVLLLPLLGALALGGLVGCGDDDDTQITDDGGTDGSINRPDSGPGPDGGPIVTDGGPTVETFTTFTKRLVLSETKDNNTPQAFSTFETLTDTPAATDFPTTFFP